MRKHQLIIALALIVAAVVIRVLPHPANFAPVTAVALFGGATLPRRYAILVPLMAMMISDTLIGWYSIMPVIWGCYVLIALASRAWLKGHSIGRGVALVAGSSVFFFLVTNFAVWVGGGLYPHTLAGLSHCYALALPFFRNTALSDVLYSAGLFGLYALASRTTAHALDAQQRQV